MLAEKLRVESEVLELPLGDINLRDFFTQKHPELANFTFSAAVDLEHRESITAADQPQKIDIMPPFAGG